MWDYIIKNIFKKMPKEESSVHSTKPISYIESHKKNIINTKEEALLKKIPSEPPKKTSSNKPVRILHCPVCHVPMITKIFPLSKIEIDECPKCKGIFLDKGELQEIMGIEIDFSQHKEPLVIYSPKGINKIEE
ncbi:MAG: hypothetical protein KatS3mg129_1179 [Leptospiraceae bacterium]|nr:MAG: hypothetical protein KatS3mg129_1179 [Leptospiraceae bacterium]